MNRLTCLVTALGLTLGVAAFTSAEFYRYTDENGNVRYTDNLQDVPIDQRSDTGFYYETQSATGNSNGDGSALDTAEASDDETPGKTSAGRVEDGVESSKNGEAAVDEATIQRMKQKKEALDREYEQLQEEAEALRKERETLVNRPYNRMQYEKKVKALNQKIDDFEQRRSAFEKEAGRLSQSKQ